MDFDVKIDLDIVSGGIKEIMVARKISANEINSYAPPCLLSCFYRFHFFGLYAQKYNPE